MDNIHLATGKGRKLVEYKGETAIVVGTMDGKLLLEIVNDNDLSPVYVPGKLLSDPWATKCIRTAVENITFIGFVD